MNTVMLIIGSLCAGGLWGFWLCMILQRGAASSAPTRPDMLDVTPEEILAVYEARREMERRGESCIHPSSQGDHKDRPYGGGEKDDDDLVMVDYFPMSKKALKGWEREQNKREMRRR